MKKLFSKKKHSIHLFSFLIAASLCFMACENSAQEKPEKENAEETVQLTEEEKELEKTYPTKVIWEAENAEQVFTTAGNIEDTPCITFENGLDLTGYKYLNFEISSPNNDEYIIGIDGVSLTAEAQWPYDIKDEDFLLEFLYQLTNEFQTIQMPYDEYKNKPLDTLFIYAIKHGERVPVADIQVKIKSITATNIKQKNNPSKEKMLYTSKTTEGYKITSSSDSQAFFILNTGDLEGYKYLNIELSSPNMKEGQYADIQSWGWGQNVFSYSVPLTNKTSTIQSVVGKDKGFWYEWDEENKENIKKPVTTDMIGGLSIFVRSFDSYDFVPDVDIYIKKVWATNTKITNDTSKDKVIFEASDSKGIKFTSAKDGKDFNFGSADLEGYKYLNVELYSPDSKDANFIELNGWGGDCNGYERECNLVSPLFKTPVVIQSLCGANFEYTLWDDEQEKNITLTSKSTVINHFFVNVKNPYHESLSDIDIYIKKIWATNTKLTNDTTKDKEIFKSTSSTGFKFITKDDWYGFNIGNADLDGYKYLNIELYSPTASANTITLDCWGNEENVANFNTLLTGEPLIIQSPFGTNYDRWYKNNQKQTITATSLNTLMIGAHYPDWVLKKDVEIYIKRIWATNAKLENDTTEDRYILISPTEEGFKVTTENDWTNRSVGFRNLDGYDYINIELYSPNSGNYDIKIDGWDSERVAVFESKLSSEPKILQVPFGLNRGHWEDFIDGVWNDNIPSTNNDLSSFAFGAHLGDNWDLKEGIDIYVKRIWVTNTELKKK